jgi:uncharacterized protein (TIGR00251 family)
MTISLRVKTNARKNEVRQLNDESFEVCVTAPPVDGKANEKVIELLAKYFDVPKRSVEIIRGLSSKHKLVHIG